MQFVVRLADHDERGVVDEPGHRPPDWQVGERAGRVPSWCHQAENGLGVIGAGRLAVLTRTSRLPCQVSAFTMVPSLERSVRWDGGAVPLRAA
jgi:hypothetical protein